MTCDVVQNRLLALPSLTRVSDDLRAHVDACAGCQRFLAEACRIDELVRAVAVPLPSMHRKADFLTRIATTEPIIQRVPMVARNGSPRSWAGWKVAAGLAAVVVVGVGVWQTFDRAPEPKPVATTPRHRLLDQQVRSTVALARANTPPGANACVGHGSDGPA